MLAGDALLERADLLIGLGKKIAVVHRHRSLPHFSATRSPAVAGRFEPVLAFVESLTHGKVPCTHLIRPEPTRRLRWRTTSTWHCSSRERPPGRRGVRRTPISVQTSARQA